MINCIILDTGVKLHHIEFKNENISGFSLQFNKEYQIDDSFEDLYGHGTAVFNIIREAHAKITNIKLSNIENGVPEKQLIYALQYIYNNYEVNIINLSLGTTICEYKNELYDICKKLYDKGVIIISAFDNEGAMSYPASFDCVIGVIDCSECHKKNDFVFFEDKCINIGAKGNIQRLAWTDPEYVFMQGNSFACAHVTRQIISFMKEGIDTYEKVMIAFRNISKKIYQLDIETENIISKQELPKQGRIAIFPFNKEMHSIVRFSDMLPYKLAKIYDSKYTGKIGSTTKRILEDIEEDIVIENILKIDMEKFDIFIFGHFDELQKYYEKDFRLKLISQLLDNQKFVVSFDELSAYEELSSSKYIYYPLIKNENVPPNRFGKLYRINKPVIGIFGTSSQQGKFTLQLTLRKMFLKDGYDVGQIGTEPHSCLFGMDCVFPMGYNQAIHIDEWQIVLFLNEQLKILCDKGKDLILVGSQAGTVLYDTGNLNRYTFLQNAFFQGTNPDAVILVINPYDEIEYLQRTINYLESGENTKVIALVVFPMDIDNNWKGMNYKKHKLNIDEFLKVREKYNKFQLPIYLLGNQNSMIELYENTINYFAE